LFRIRIPSEHPSEAVAVPMKSVDSAFESVDASLKPRPWVAVILYSGFLTVMLLVGAFNNTGKWIPAHHYNLFFKETCNQTDLRVAFVPRKPLNKTDCSILVHCASGSTKPPCYPLEVAVLRFTQAIAWVLPFTPSISYLTCRTYMCRKSPDVSARIRLLCYFLLLAVTLLIYYLKIIFRLTFKMTFDSSDHAMATIAGGCVISREVAFCFLYYRKKRLQKLVDVVLLVVCFLIQAYTLYHTGLYYHTRKESVMGCIMGLGLVAAFLKLTPPDAFRGIEEDSQECQEFTAPMLANAA